MSKGLKWAVVVAVASVSFLGSTASACSPALGVKQPPPIAAETIFVRTTDVGQRYTNLDEYLRVYSGSSAVCSPTLYVRTSALIVALIGIVAFVAVMIYLKRRLKI